MKTAKALLVLVLIATLAATGYTWFYQAVSVDTKPPVMTTDRDTLEVSVHATDEELKAGLTAIDDRDGDISSQILVDHVSTLVTSDTARITYAVFDSSDNVSKLTRNIRYTDYKAPRFHIDEPLIYEVGHTVTLLDRLFVQDALDGNISNRIRMTTQNLNNGVEGIYSITLQATNSLGDTAVLPISVIIRSSRSIPQILLKEQLVYIERGSLFQEEYYIARVLEGDKILPNSKVTINSNVDVNTPGVYEVFYEMKGRNGTGTSILTVVVE